MAPPTGIATYTIYIWEADGRHHACLHDSFFSIHLRGSSEDDVFSRVKQAAQSELRAWLEINEPYYVEDLLYGYTRFERKRLPGGCSICSRGLTS